MQTKEFVTSLTSESAYETRVKDKVLLLDSVNKPNIKKKLKKRLKISKPILDKSQFLYDSFTSLNELWLQYISQVVKDPLKFSQNSALLVKSDFHGAKFVIKRSRIPSLIGLIGIVVEETEGSFSLACIDGYKRVLKGGTEFSFLIGDCEYTINGDLFKGRPAERAWRKFKAAEN